MSTSCMTIIHVIRLPAYFYEELLFPIPEAVEWRIKGLKNLEISI